MSTIADAMDTATGELRACRLAMDALRGTVTDQLAAKTTQAQTVINNFLGRPPVQNIYVDPINGSDTNDGSTSAKALKSIDNLLDNLGTTATSIILLNDATVRRRRNLYASLTITGGQIAANAAGWTPIVRTITFLGTAENSPGPDGSTFCSGFWLIGPGFVTNNIGFVLPTQASGQTFIDHIRSEYGTSVLIVGSTLTAASGAGSLVGGTSLPFDSFFSISLGSGAAGHLFRGVGSGVNPNGAFQYRSNITSG